MGRTYRRRALDRKKTLRKQRGGLVEAKNSACTDDHRPLLACHLHADMVHDFGATFVHEEVISQPPAFMVYDDSGVQDCKTDEDAIVQLFQTGNIGDTLIPNRPERMGTKLIFSVQEETAVFGNDNVPVVLPRPGVAGVTRNENVAIVQDAGKQLFKELGVTNLITFGSILDPALKPIQKTETPMVFVPPDGTQLLLRTCEYGFNEGLLDQVCIAKFDGNFVSCGFHLTDEGGKNKWVDAIMMKDVNGPAELTGRKPINNVNIIEAGYFTSIANATDPVSQVAVREKLGQQAGDIPLQHQRRLFIGKTLGDVLLVASIERNITTPAGMVSNPFLPGNGATLRNFTTGVHSSPNPSLSYFVLNTGDRLNHTRAFIKGVPSIYQQRRKGEEKEKDAVKTFEYIPGALLAGETFPGVEDFYRKNVRDLATKSKGQYDLLLTNLKKESKVDGDFDLQFSKFTEGGRLIKSAQTGFAKQLIQDVVQKIEILRNIVEQFFLAVASKDANFTQDTAKPTYRRACELYKLLTPQKTTFRLKGDITNAAVLLIKLPKTEKDYVDLVEGTPFASNNENTNPVLKHLNIGRYLVGTYTVKLLRAFSNIEQNKDWDYVKTTKDYQDYFAGKFKQGGGGRRLQGGADEEDLYEYLKRYNVIQSVLPPLKLLHDVIVNPPRLIETAPLIELAVLFVNSDYRLENTTMEDIKLVLQIAQDLKAYVGMPAVYDAGLSERFVAEAEDVYNQCKDTGGSLPPGKAPANTQTERTYFFNQFAEWLNKQTSLQYGYIAKDEKNVEEEESDLSKMFQARTDSLDNAFRNAPLRTPPPGSPQPESEPGTLSLITGYLSQPGSEGRGGISEGTAEATPAKPTNGVGRALFPESPGRNIANSVLPQLTRFSEKVEDPDPPATITALNTNVADAFRILVGEERRPREDVERVLAGLYAPTGNVGQMTAAPGVQGQGLGGLSPETARTGTGSTGSTSPEPAAAEGDIEMAMAGVGPAAARGPGGSSGAASGVPGQFQGWAQQPGAQGASESKTDAETGLPVTFARATLVKGRVTAQRTKRKHDELNEAINGLLVRVKDEAETKRRRIEGLLQKAKDALAKNDEDTANTYVDQAEDIVMEGGNRRVLPDLNLPPPSAGRRKRRTTHRKRL